MNLRKKKMLAAKTLGVGKNKIVFVKSRIDEIKEAITKQDIRDLYNEGAILIRQVMGRRKVERKRKKISVGNVRKKIKARKRKVMWRKVEPWFIAINLIVFTGIWAYVITALALTHFNS